MPAKEGNLPLRVSRMPSETLEDAPKVQKAAKPKGANVTLSTANGARLGMHLIQSEVPSTPYRISIKGLLPGGQAETNGIKIGMVIHKINGKDIRKMTLQDVTVLLAEAGETI